MQIGNLSVLKDLDHEVGIDHTDHTDHTDHLADVRSTADNVFVNRSVAYLASDNW